MDKVARARLALSGLTVYRNILNDRLMGGFVRILEAANGVDLRGFTDAYGEFVMALSQQSDGLDFGACLSGLVRYDDNPFTRQAAGGRIGQGLAAAASHDLAALTGVVGLTAADIKEAAGHNFADEEASAIIRELPEFKTGDGIFDGAQADVYNEISEFYKKNGCGQFARYGAFRWQGGDGQNRLYGIAHPDPVTLADLKGYEYERGVVVDNTLDFLEGDSANNILLYGDRGTGKSSTVKAVFNRYRSMGLRIIEVTRDCIVDFPLIVREIADLPLKFIIFIDDLSFSDDDANFSALKAVLEGGLASRPGNCVIYATSNRRHLVKESFSERQSDDVHAADTMQEKLSLADRFGITVTFSAPDQRLYFSIIEAMAADRGISVPKEELQRGAAQWALRFNGRSPRAARQYVDWAQSRLKRGQPVTNF